MRKDTDSGCVSWFERITGFEEQGYAHARSRLQVHDGCLVSAHSQRRPRVGHLEMPTLGQLRARVADFAPSASTGPMALEHLRGDVRALHADPANAQALFQVASQFNLLEMVSPGVTPDDGVTRYQHDPTQGPACAMAAGAATIYRNYLMPVGGHIGQTAQRQVDCLADLGNQLGNGNDRLWAMRNGYPMFTREGVAGIDARLAGYSTDQREALKAHLRIGLHWQVEVTDVPPPGHLVSQAFCSALPVAYQRHRQTLPWQRFASLVLEAAYEATLLAAVLNHARTGCPLVYLTRLGGGVFGNAPAWIDAAIEHALARVEGRGLRVVMVTLG